jgi:rfaE bifunctional protein nucleotidyltransferase chain/domain
MTNGCFDMLHVGHVRCLQAARALGDALIVVVNTDAAVRVLKGEGRPVQTCEDRAEILRALRCVDGIHVTDQTCLALIIRAIRPAIWAKGGDYTLETLDQGEVAAAREVGAEIVLLPKFDGPSTTAIVKKMRGE